LKTCQRTGKAWRFEFDGMLCACVRGGEMMEILQIVSEFKKKV